MRHNSIASDAETLALPETEEAQRGEFEDIAIIGVGMIGGSVGLALRESGFRGRITGLLAQYQISIRDLRVVHVRETVGGVLYLAVASPSEAELAVDLLKNEGFDAHLRE